MAGNPRIEELRKKLEKEPGSRRFAQLAEELRKDGEFEDAIRVAREGLQKHANYPSARMTLGRALFDTGDWAAARVEFEQVLKGAPDNILASRLLAESLEGLGDVPGAIARYKKTLGLAPGDKQVTARLEALEKGGGAASAPAAAPAAAPAKAAMAGIRAAGPAVVAAPPIPTEPPPPVDSSAPIRLVDVDAPMELERPNEGPSSFVPGPTAASAPAPAAVAAAPAAGGPSGAEAPSAAASSEPAPIPLVAAEEDFEIERPNEPPRPAASEAPPTSARAAEASPPAPAPPPHEAAMEFDFDAGPTGSTIPFAPAPAPAPAASPEPSGEVQAEPEPEPEPVRPPPPPPQVPLVDAAEVRTAVVAPPPPPPPEPATTVEVPWRAQPSPVEPTPGGETPSDALMSATLAELYFNQGFTDKAVEVYRQLLEREPDNERLRRRLAELQAPPAPPAPTVPPAPASAPVAEPVVEPASLSAPAPRPPASSGAHDAASRRLALERTIARLEGMLAAIKKG